MPLTREADAVLERVRLDRRDVLKGTAGIVVAFSTAPHAAFAQQDPREDALDAWLAVDSSGRVTAYTGKCELGQGIMTAQAQLVAEELSVPLRSVTIVQCDTALTPDQGTTSGSQSHPTNFNDSHLALAAATARARLVELAATQLGASAEQLSVTDGVVRVVAAPARRVSYAELLGGRAFELALDPAARRKPQDEWTILGTPAQRLDVPALVAAEVEFVHDVRVPGMVHGRVVRPPAVGATLEAVATESVEDLPGNVRVVVRNDFVGVVADREWQAVQAAAKLEVAWSSGTGLPPSSELYALLQSHPSRDTLLVDSGDVDANLAAAADVVRAKYYHAYQMHGSIGAACAVADVRADKATLWSATQAVYALRSTTAMLLGRPTEDVHVMFRRGPGCYGVNGADTVSYDAALLSQAVGRPVRVLLTRADEMAWENYGYPFVLEQRAGLDAAGDIVVWDHESWSASRGGRPGYGTPGNVVTGMLAGFPVPRPAPRRAPAPTAPYDNGQNAAPSYVTGCAGGFCGGTGRVASERVLLHVVESPLFTGPLRSPWRLQNTFAHECFIDEIAARVGADPVAYRLRHIADPRLAAVLGAAADAAGWASRPSPRLDAPRTGRASGRGAACVFYEGDNGYAAMVAEVEVDQDSGELKVGRLVVAVDCGPISNPDGLENQIEGGALQGLSRALGEEVTWDRDRVTSIDWRTYRSLDLSFEPPAIECVLLDRSDVPAMGAGETSITIVAAAVANAVFDATGARVRHVPFTPARVRAALEARARMV